MSTRFGGIGRFIVFLKNKLQIDIHVRLIIIEIIALLVVLESRR